MHVSHCRLACMIQKLNDVGLQSLCLCHDSCACFRLAASDFSHSSSSSSRSLSWRAVCSRWALYLAILFRCLTTISCSLIRLSASMMPPSVITDICRNLQTSQHRGKVRENATLHFKLDSQSSVLWRERISCSPGECCYEPPLCSTYNASTDGLRVGFIYFGLGLECIATWHAGF